MAVVVTSYAAALIGRERGTRTNPLSLPMRQRQPHSRHTERGSRRAIFGLDLFVGVRRGVRIDSGVFWSASPNPVHVTPPFNSCRPFEASGSLSSHARIQFLAEQFRGEAPIHVLSLSAGSTGLVGAVYGQHSAERKRACPNQDGANPHRNGASR